MRKILVAFLVLAALVAIYSDASAAVYRRWATVSWYDSYEIESDYVTNENWLSITNIYDGTKNKVNLGKGEYIGFSNITFYYEEQRISFFYEFGDGITHFIDVHGEWMGTKKPKVFRLSDTKTFRFHSFKSFGDVLYVNVKEYESWWPAVGGEIRAYDINDPEKSYTVTKKYRGDRDVIFGNDHIEDYQIGVIIGIIYGKWDARRVMYIYDAATRKLIRKCFIPPGANVTYIGIGRNLTEDTLLSVIYDITRSKILKLTAE